MLKTLKRNLQRSSGMMTRKPTRAAIAYSARTLRPLPVPRILTPWYIVITPDGYTKVPLKDLGVRRRPVCTARPVEQYQDSHKVQYTRHSNGMITSPWAGR